MPPSIRPPADLDLTQLLGEWHIVATTLPFWRGKRAPRVRYTPLNGGWLDELHYEQRGIFGGWKTRGLAGVDTPDPVVPGSFTWRGAGVLAVLSSRWCFVEVAHDGAWAATWFSPASLGLTPEGMDIYARDPAFPSERVGEVIRALGERPELSHLGGWFEPERCHPSAPPDRGR